MSASDTDESGKKKIKKTKTNKNPTAKAMKHPNWHE